MSTSIFSERADGCCGCGSCLVACPVNAISICEDKSGFLYPYVDDDLCIGCGACKRACGFQQGIGGLSLGPYFAAAGRKDIEDSASGGVFVSLARSVISQGGVAYGASYVNQGDSLFVRHVRAKQAEELACMQNSKYVQSDAACCFRDLLDDLRNGREVLFSGTPCQVAGLRGFLGRDWPNLTTIDLVCHGVPSHRMFSDMVATVQHELGGQLIDIRFRCKDKGWKHSLLLLLLLDDGRKIRIPAASFAYYDLFLKLKTMRDSCYSCPYGGSYRAADITIGDFWGIEKSRPDVLEQDGFDMQGGISCLLINNERGKSFLDVHGEHLNTYEVSFDDISAGNEQLRHPSTLPSDRDLYLETFAVSGWQSVEQLWKRRERGLRYKAKKIAKAVIPNRLLQSMKRLYKGL